MMNIIEATTESDLNVIVKINSHEFTDKEKERLRRDFNNGHFHVFYLTNQVDSSKSVDVASTLAYVVVHYSYSTWQNRVLFISDFWLRSSLSSVDDVQPIVDAFRHKFFALARTNNCKRINFHVRHVDANKSLLVCLQRCGMRDLTRDEDWSLFQLGAADLEEFARDQHDLYASKFEVIRVEDMNVYARQIYAHIHELCVFEKLEEQFECSIEELINDYDPAKCPSKHRLYEAMVILNKETNKTVGFALYYRNYNLKYGLGYYLEDLYIQEPFRRQGLGTALWKRAADDCLRRLNANYMQWAVLSWNKSAISFYYKFKSVNLTEIEKLHLFRFLTHQIYEKLIDQCC